MLGECARPRRDLCRCSVLPSLASVTTWYDAVEAAFTDTFTRDLWSCRLRGAVLDWLGPAAVHYVEAMPDRKYRAVLPWLTLGCPEQLVARCLVPELLFAVFYCLDELTDRKTVRYGVPTAYAVHGSREVARSVDRALHGTPLTGPFARLPADVWNEGLAEMADGQSLRSGMTLEEFSWEGYLSAARRRTAFVGQAWSEVLSTGGSNRTAALVSSAYPSCAEAGQLRNDLRNATGREVRDGGARYSDFGGGKVTALSGLLWERAGRRDRRWLREYVWGRGNPSAVSRATLDRLLAEYEVRSHVVAAVGRSVNLIRSTLTAVPDDRIRTVWDAWVTRQFEVGVGRDYDSGDPSISAFEAAVRALRSRGGRADQDGLRA